jgi:hypothetical protein
MVETEEAKKAMASKKRTKNDDPVFYLNLHFAYLISILNMFKLDEVIKRGCKQQM